MLVKTQYLIDQDADVNVNHENLFGHTPLINAVRLGKIEIINLLIHEGADINHVCRSGESILHHAVSNAKKEAVILLLEKGAKTDIRDSSNWTPLFEAVYRYHARCNLSVFVDNGYWPMSSVDGVEKDIAILLLQKGANPTSLMTIDNLADPELIFRLYENQNYLKMYKPGFLHDHLYDCIDACIKQGKSQTVIDIAQQFSEVKVLPFITEKLKQSNQSSPRDENIHNTLTDITAQLLHQGFDKRIKGYSTVHGDEMGNKLKNSDKERGLIRQEYGEAVLSKFLKNAVELRRTDGVAR